MLSKSEIVLRAAVLAIILASQTSASAAEVLITPEEAAPPTMKGAVAIFQAAA